MALVIERAERLKDNLPEILVPLTRLAELVSTLTIIGRIVRLSQRGLSPRRTSLRYSFQRHNGKIFVLLSEHVQSPTMLMSLPCRNKVSAPPRGDVYALNYFATATLDLLTSSFPPSVPESSATDPAAYHPALKPLYAHFIRTLHSICGPFTHDPTELAYIAAARWPGFVKPVLDVHRKDLDEDEAQLTPPTEEQRLRLLRLFTPSFTAALEALYPRLSSATHWAQVHAPPPGLLSIPPARAPEALIAQTATNASALRTHGDTETEAGIEALPRMARFVLIAAFLASTNPARSDLRMFGRGSDERKRRKRKVGTPRKPKPGTTGTAVKIPQRLLGPTTFPLDRLIAILGVLLEENDAETRPVAPQYTLPGEYTEMEIARVALYSNVRSAKRAVVILLFDHLAHRLWSLPVCGCSSGRLRRTVWMAHRLSSAASGTTSP